VRRKKRLYQLQLPDEVEHAWLSGGHICVQGCHLEFFGCPTNQDDVQALVCRIWSADRTVFQKMLFLEQNAVLEQILLFCSGKI